MRHSSWVFEETWRAGVGQPAGASCPVWVQSRRAWVWDQPRERVPLWTPVDVQAALGLGTGRP